MVRREDSSSGARIRRVAEKETHHSLAKMLFFDMEGTIFKKAIPPAKTNVPPSAWFVIAEKLGPQALEEELSTQHRWKKGEYPNYMAWMEETVLIHKKYGLNKILFQNVIDGIEFTPGVKEAFRYINKAKVPTCLLSGGFKYQADKAIRELKIKHAFIGCEYFWDENGNLDHWVLSPSDEAGKVSFMKLMIKEYKIKKEECVFVGDGDNDIHLAKEVGTSIAFNASERLAKFAKFSIRQEPHKENFMEVLKYLDI